MQLLYGPNVGQANYSRFNLPEFNKLYDEARRLPDSPARTKLFSRMTELVRGVRAVARDDQRPRGHVRASVGAQLRAASDPLAGLGVRRRRRGGAGRRALDPACRSYPGPRRACACENVGLRRRRLESLMFTWFERLVHPYPDAPPATPPRGFFAFLWACTRGLRRYILAMTLLHRRHRRVRGAAVRMIGHIVDWLAAVKPAQLWTRAARHAAAARRRARRQHRCWSRCSRRSSSRRWPATSRCGCAGTSTA